MQAAASAAVRLPLNALGAMAIFTSASWHGIKVFFQFLFVPLRRRGRKQAADALSDAHSLKTLHCDITPANLLPDTQGVWLPDFGLAKAAQSEDGFLLKDLFGTLRYMAAEQFLGNSDHSSDVYRPGLTFYELLALR
jgi:serine/threonine protein kinase